MNIHLGTEVIYHRLKALFIGCADVHTVIEVVIRQKRCCRPLPGQAQNMAAGIAQEIALCDANQSKLSGIIVGIHFNSVAQGLGTGETDFISNLPGEPQESQSIFWQDQFHRRFWQTPLHKAGIGWPGFQAVPPVLRQIQRKLIVQLHITQGDEPARVRQPGGLLQEPGLLLGELYKGGVPVTADGYGLLLPHSGQHSGRLPYGGGHHGG